MQKRESVAEEEVGEDLDDVADEVELVALLEEFYQQQEQGSDCVDRQG